MPAGADVLATDEVEGCDWRDAGGRSTHASAKRQLGRALCLVLAGSR